MKFLLTFLLALVPVTNAAAPTAIDDCLDLLTSLTIAPTNNTAPPAIEDGVNLAAPAAAVVDEYLAPLPIIETFMGNRRTNVGCHATLYPHANMGLVVNCHPYNPTDVAGNDNLPAVASHPLIVKYDPALHRDMLEGVLPEFIRGRLAALGNACQLFLNVQDNPWNGTAIELRAHAFSDFFPAMGGSYAGVSAQVCRGDGTMLLESISSVHLHDGVASPNNFNIAGLDHTVNEAFYSIVTYGGRSVITRHILLTVPARELFQGLLCTPTELDRSPSFFAIMLGANYTDFLQHYGVI